MTSSELIDSRKRVLIGQLKGYDSTLKLKGNNSFFSIMQDIDSGKYIEYGERSLYDRLSKVEAFAILKCERTNNMRAKKFITAQKTLDEIHDIIGEYVSLHSDIYTLSEDEVKYFESIANTEKDRLDIVIDTFKSLCLNKYEFITMYNSRLYSCKIYNSDDNINGISLDVWVSYSDKDIPTSAYRYRLTIDKNNTEEITRDMTNLCLNKGCVFHKTSPYEEYVDGSKEVLCTNEDCKKCDAFKDTLRPDELVTVACAVLYAISLRNSSTRVEIENAPKYEPIPLPESDKDVVIYLDKYYDEIRKTRVKVYDDNYIPGTHASPREHIRKSCIVHRKNGKTFERKGCIVNEGHTKTSYTIKATKRSKENLTKKPEDYIRELLDLKEDI